MIGWGASGCRAISWGLKFNGCRARLVSRSQTLFLFFFKRMCEGKEKGLVKLHRPACSADLAFSRLWA